MVRASNRPVSVPPVQSSRLAASRLACRRGDRLLFRGLDFELAAGQIVWLRGPNGSGKTSLLRLLAGLSTPAEGAITWGGTPLREAGAAWCRSLCYLAHANALKDDLSVLESLQFLARLHGHGDGEAGCTEALRRVGLFSRRHAAVRTLSQGQRRRVALARLHLDAAAPVWILDEPYDALDAEGTAMLDAALSAHARRGGAAVLTSHIDLTLADPAPTVLQLDAYRVQ
ncbi:MAG: cytochrome c biogenesis heme-transporting ATPase CcmA [Piscinibacter sp.]|uniref:cytochrome c biogenesis heme-transporting ATPase CcmA n=1 Tax=Piscinibacter sp. TaxID=1903157 RepID=UPI001B720703|nr:cytochrome c biogenesis heme-transporting ATPase CcmA [Piscinibacter sp.]MBP5989263.1 cytochrome c biogenesis heme-transporting ATPase CcmA [Piscinibacter sp.]MBP6026847.1 cytochrome c biogenesis heme-transporting ATPase CcmA [Piscinibacter sp.]